MSIQNIPDNKVENRQNANPILCTSLLTTVTFVALQIITSVICASSPNILERFVQLLSIKDIIGGIIWMNVLIPIAIALTGAILVSFLMTIIFIGKAIREKKNIPKTKPNEIIKIKKGGEIGNIYLNIKLENPVAYFLDQSHTPYEKELIKIIQRKLPNVKFELCEDLKKVNDTSKHPYILFIVTLTTSRIVNMKNLNLLKDLAKEKNRKVCVLIVRKQRNLSTIGTPTRGEFNIKSDDKIIEFALPNKQYLTKVNDDTKSSFDQLLEFFDKKPPSLKKV